MLLNIKKHLIIIDCVPLGDTLFLSACGRFFEGNAQQMHEALIEKLSKLPDQCVMFLIFNIKI